MSYFVIQTTGQLPGLTLFWSGKVWCGKAKRYKSRKIAERAAEMTVSSMEFDKFKSEVMEVVD